MSWWRDGNRGEDKEMKKRVKMCYVQVPAPQRNVIIMSFKHVLTKETIEKEKNTPKT